MVVMGQPEVYFTYKPELFDAEGDVVDEKTREFLGAWVDRFSAWIERTAERPAHTQADAA
jgi:chromate reductase